MSKLRRAVPALLTASALTLLAPASRAQDAKPEARQEVQSVSIPVTYFKPSALIALLREPKSMSPKLIPAGVIGLSPDDLGGVILVKGSPASVARIREIVLLLDAPSATVRFQVRILRPTATEANPTSAPEVVAVASVEAKNNANASLSILAAGMFIDLSVIPHVNGDGSLTLTGSAAFSQTEGDGMKMRKREVQALTTKRFLPGVGTIIFGIQKFSVITDLPTPPGPDQYLIEITPTVVSTSLVSKR